MFPNQSSSYYEISKNNVAFVQIQINYKEDQTGDVSGMAQPPMSNNPPLQVPDKRDEMVVSTGESVGTPNLTVIAGHPSHAPTKLPSAHVCERESDGSSRMPGAERLTGALCFDSIKSISSINYLTSDKDLSSLMKKNPTQSSTLDNIPQANDEPGDDSFKFCDDTKLMTKKTEVLRLRGGGETSLTGTAGWGSPPAAQSGSTGWNGGSSQPPSQPAQQQNNTGNNTPGNQGSGQPQNWGSGNNNNTNNNNNNANRQSGPTNTGTGQQAQGPPSQNQAPATTSVSNTTTSTINTSTTQANGNPTSAGNNNNNPNPGPQQPGQNGPAVQNGTSNNPQQPGGAPQNPGNNPQNPNNGGSSWAAAAGKGLPATTPGTTTSSSSSSVSGSSTSTKQQLEQLNTMREALFSQDGWGGQNVNQDSSWDIPGSPEPGGKEGGTSAPGPMWKVPINNGTDLWEANLRNGGNPPPQNTTQKAPWGHTPSNNIGGTWGEEDEGDASNVWTGVPPAPTGSAPQWPNQPPPIWPGGGGGGGNGGGGGGGGGGAKKDGEWGGPNWNDQRGDPRDIRHGDMRQIIEARDNMRQNSVDHRSMGGNDVLMRGDPRGISGRLNGVTNEAMWTTGPGHPLHMQHHHPKIPNHPNQPGVNQWASGGGPPLKELSSIPKTNGWEEPSPPAQRRNMPNYDDGTSLWGAQQHTRPTMQGLGVICSESRMFAGRNRAYLDAGQNKVSHWKEMPATAAMGRGGLPPTMTRGNSNMKPDQPLWPHHPRNNGWGEGGGMVDVGGPWGDEKPAAPWMEQTLNPPSWVHSGPKHKPSWDGSDLDPASWVGHPNKQQSKPISKEVIWTSKQFRMLTDMGYKKEDVENALRASSLSLEEALEQLNASRNLGDRWRHSDLDPDHGGIINPFPSPQQAICIPFQSNGGGGGGVGGNVLANANPSLSTLSPAIMQKILSQQPPAPPQQQPPFTQSSRAQQTQQPSPQQLRMLVQQIQMAVQSGFLSPQILNQPLAPQTLLLLNQLLQQIKTLQQLTQQMQHHQLISGNSLGKSNQVLQISVQITKTKQQITNLQNQIAAQQAVYVKQAQQTPPTDFFNKHEPINLHPSFSDMSLKDTHGSTNTSQQSRLNQWKLPALDKDTDIGSSNPDFSRAPGTTTKATPGNSSPNMNPLLGQPDGTWSSVSRNNCDTGWPDSGTDDSSSKDWPTSTQPPSQAFSDLVPEFEPGKPWKGNPLKSIEDDPSLTPGSVMPSPLSIPSLKDTQILSSSASMQGKASPTTSSSLDLCPLPLSSSTWSFNPPVSSTSGLSKLSGGKSVNSSAGGGASTGATWSEGNSTPGQPGGTSSSELWAPPKRPPPGLSAKPGSQGSQGQQSQNNNSGAPTANGWLSNRWGGPQNSWSHLAPTGQAGSTWLLLRNLTPQIDGSTLKTLCLQHGPLQNFHLYLNHGIALAKYASREEANKAQGALNNCVLGNTTIFAESPSETDVLQLLQHLGHSTGGQQNSSQSSGSWRQAAKPEPSYSQGLWAGAGSTSGTGGGGNSLWGDTTDQHRNTPSSINSFLPGDLLGGESI